MKSWGSSEFEGRNFGLSQWLLMDRSRKYFERLMKIEHSLLKCIHASQRIQMPI
jgi:hypothetical protein